MNSEEYFKQLSKQTDMVSRFICWFYKRKNYKQPKAELSSASLVLNQELENERKI